jgi:flagellar biosynthesis GTPase FlhF
MKTHSKKHHQHILDSNGLLPRKNWKTALLHIALLVVVVFLTEMSGAQADMVFDFQMKLAKKGNAEAQFKVGEMYESGRGVEKNMNEAMKWINKAAAQGNKAAGYNLLYKDLEKNGVTKENKPGLADLQNAARDGDGYAQYYVGLMHSNGVGVRKNSNEALDWLGKASLVGITAAEAEIARVNGAADQGAQLRAQQEAAARQEAKRKEEERRKLEAQRKQQEAEAAAKKKAEQDRKLARQREAERKAAAEAAAEEEAKKLRLIAEKEAEAEKKRQAVLAQRKQKEAEKKTQFESDPCSGKSARFLSTCK